MHLRKHSSDKNICYYILKLNYGYRHYGEQMINYFMIWMLNRKGKFPSLMDYTADALADYRES